jgi:hypothetical protein
MLAIEGLVAVPVTTNAPLVELTPAAVTLAAVTLAAAAAEDAGVLVAILAGVLVAILAGVLVAILAGVLVAILAGVLVAILTGVLVAILDQGTAGDVKSLVAEAAEADAGDAASKVEVVDVGRTAEAAVCVVGDAVEGDVDDVGKTDDVGVVAVTCPVVDAASVVTSGAVVSG